MTKKENVAKIAKEVKTSVEKKYKIPSKTDAGIGYTYPEYAYILAKAVITPGKDVAHKKNIGKAPKPSGSTISRTVKKGDYVKLAKNLVSFVDNNKRLPNYLTYGGYKIRTRVYIDAFARIVNYYYTNKKMPAYVNVNSKAFTKPSTAAQSKDEVFNYFVKKFGNVKTIDEAFNKVKERSYGYYYDDVYSNKTSIDRMYSKSGINCTDSCQVFWHIAKALGYDVRCLHVRCSGGDGHVRLQVKHPKNTGGKWINRDPAAILSANGRPLTYNWCDSNYTLLGTNSSWFMANLNR